MARPGIGYSEVADAATQLIGQGRNPTVEQVRHLLGTGSSTTIANHLRQWKANQESTDLISAKENIPAELVAIMKGLWERVLDHSQEQVKTIESSYEEMISELQTELNKYKLNNSRWQKLYDQWLAEKNKLTQEKLTLEQALEFSQKENSSLNAKQDTLLQQLQDKQERIDELHRLHKQTQENLEHYRESVREQRLLDQQQHENQRQLLQSEIKTLNEQAIMQREKVLLLQQQYQSLQHTNVHLEKSYSSTQDELAQTRVKLEESENAKNQFSHANQHLQLQLDNLQALLEEKSNQFIEIQAENKVLSRQLSDAKQAYTDAQNQNKILSQAQFELSQEKAQLIGQLKQMQKMIIA